MPAMHPGEPTEEPLLRVVRRPADERRATCQAPRVPPRPGQSRLARQARPCEQGASRGRSCPCHGSRPVLVTKQDRSGRPIIVARGPRRWLRPARLSRQPEPGRSPPPDVGGSPRPGRRAARGSIVLHHEADRYTKVEHTLPTPRSADRPDRALRVSHHTSRSCRALLTVPAHGTLDGFSKRCRLLAELPLEPGVIYDERFLELVEHLKYFAQSRVEETHGPQQNLRCRLHACWLAHFLEDHLHKLACCDGLGAG
jgi:hypothetical protein